VFDSRRRAGNREFTVPLRKQGCGRMGGKTMKDFSFTSESVCAGHPDKICDQISDAIVDEVLKIDNRGKIAVETLVTENRIIIAGEVNSTAKVDFEGTARKQIKRLGYNNPVLKFTYRSPIHVFVHQQSTEIAVGVEKKGAGDQGMMFGFACSETKNFMPIPIEIAHALTRKVDQLRETKKLPYLRPDGKSQVTVGYKNGKPSHVAKVILAVPHSENVDVLDVKKDIFREAVLPVLEEYGFKIRLSDVILNGTGVWHFSGPAADTGVTGRKIIVDTYGGYARVGGGAFSGKDPTKVDRSGAYAARFLAKNIVGADLAERAEVSLAYFIGAKRPVMQEVETFGTEKKSKKIIMDFMENLLDTSVEGILEGLNLRQPIYLPTAAYGHFGRPEFPWEKIAY
jgi:S-adenosylmethionine synthetase